MAAAIHAATSAITAHISCFVHSPWCAPGTDVALYTTSRPMATSPIAASASGTSIDGMRTRSLIGIADLGRVAHERRQLHVLQRVGQEHLAQHRDRKSVV